MVGFRLDPAVPEQRPDDVYRDHVGAHPQKQPGYSYVGAAVLRGRISAEQMRRAADLADEFAGGELRTTNMQNLLVANIPNRNVEQLAQGLEAVGLRVADSPFWRGAIACRRTPYHTLAIPDRQSVARRPHRKPE